MRSSTAESYDLVVIGGGPGGSTVSTLTAKQGHRVLLLERGTFPRYQIGESLLPATVHGIARLLGVDQELRRAGFTKKRGGTFRWGANPEPWTFSFAVSPKLAAPTSYAYQVERMKFDQILLDNARANGVEVRESSTVVDVIEVDGRVGGVRYVDADGGEHTVEATFVVDASGNTGRTHRHVGGERRYSEFFRNLALFGYFEGGKRLPEPYSGNILSAAFDDGWFWYIPLSPTLTSVGAVVHRDAAEKVQGDREAALNRLIEACPLIKEYLADARRVTSGPYGELRVRKDYSYCDTRFWRPGMALVGDAACFVDPVFSSGVHLATYSGLLAARSINSCLAGTVGEKEAFQEFERRYRREYGVFYEFLVSFYGMHVDEQSYFWAAKKVTKTPLPELEAFVELVGGLASGDVIGGTPESVADELVGGAEALAEAADGSDTSSGELHAKPVVANAMAESANLQAEILLGAEATPLFPDGLVSTLDGLHWTYPRASPAPR
ncbi:tryptophan 7-halogenase [Actinoallomurus iriomotensis]|uniref:FAD-binding protein n=1 Tax=Actinoallomurus iriomotensis TaxID=478107 RepID=A0A9W6S3F5_9ACTN|nr:tryptophan 7-halogenase [Actinoallomurus iriomotensis]GLY85062.1 FAD-binding protein [Actinoallomurus iriomotensis]